MSKYNSLEGLVDYACKKNQRLVTEYGAGCSLMIYSEEKPKRQYHELPYGVGTPQGGQGVNDHIYQYWAFWYARDREPWE